MAVVLALNGCVRDGQPGPGSTKRVVAEYRYGDGQSSAGAYRGVIAGDGSWCDGYNPYTEGVNAKVRPGDLLHCDWKTSPTLEATR